MTNRKREFAKFACGAEAFHTVLHAYLWLSGTTLPFFGISHAPALNIVGTLINAVLAVLLGMCGWGRLGRRSAG